MKHRRRCLIACGMPVLTMTAACGCFADDPAPPQGYGATPYGVTPVAPPAQPPPPPKGSGSLLGAITRALGVDTTDSNAAAGAVNEQNLRAIEANYRPAFQHYLLIELAFMRRVCKPEAKVFAAIAKAANADLASPLRKYATAQWRQQQQGNNEDAVPSDLNQVMRDLLVPLVAAKMGAEKVQIYRDEYAKRAEARKHATVLNMVAMLDEKLILSADQRAKLVKSFTAQYSNAWSSTFEMLLAGDMEELPSIRDECIVPFLEEDQKGVWKQIKERSEVTSSAVPDIDDSDDATEVKEISRIIEGARDGK